MDTKYSHLVQVGKVGENLILYFEDYAHTFLKKNKGEEKIYLYGERRKEEDILKLYIYGTSLSPKLEKTYFKEYEKIGVLRTKEEEFYWVGEGKEEKKITGYYIFYATNKAMQEYLIDHTGEQKEIKREEKVREKKEVEEVPIREVLLTKGYGKLRKKEYRQNFFLVPALTITVAASLLFLSGKDNTKEKIEVFRQIVKENITSPEEETLEFTIEEKEMQNTEGAKEEKSTEESMDVEQENTQGTIEEKELQEEQIVIEETVFVKEEQNEPVSSAKEVEKEEKPMEEYIVEEGDTLAWICKKYYGTTDRMEEICQINKITNEDYIEPGQKLYLPK